MALINFITAVILQKIHGYNETTRTWPDLIRAMTHLSEVEFDDLRKETHS